MTTASRQHRKLLAAIVLLGCVPVATANAAERAAAPAEGVTRLYIVDCKDGSFARLKADIK